MTKRLKQLIEQNTSKIDIVPTPGQDKGQNVSFKNPGPQAEKDFVNKHVVQKTDYPVKQKSGSNDDIFSGAKQTKKKRIADQENEKEASMYESDDIIKNLSNNKSDFVKKYGAPRQQVDEMEDDDGWYAHREMHGDKGVSKDDWKKGVRMNRQGERVNINKPKVKVEESVEVFELGDGHEVTIDEDTMNAIDAIFESLNDEQQDQFSALFAESLQTNTNLLEWVRSVA